MYDTLPVQAMPIATIVGPRSFIVMIKLNSNMDKLISLQEKLKVLKCNLCYTTKDEKIKIIVAPNELDLFAQPFFTSS